jgi:hypothetical protein
VLGCWWRKLLWRLFSAAHCARPRDLRLALSPPVSWPAFAADIRAARRHNVLQRKQTGDAPSDRPTRGRIAQVLSLPDMRQRRRDGVMRSLTRD